MDIDEAKRRAAAGPVIMMVRRIVSVAIGLVSTVILARILSPTDFGLANMANVMLAFAGIFRDFGLTNAVLRKGRISQTELSMIFWFNAASTLVLATLVAICSPFIATFYNEAVVQFVVLLSLIGFIVSGLSAQHRALLNRELRFGTLAITDTLASLIGLTVIIVLAFNGLGVWSIVLGGAIQALAAASTYIYLSGWKPSRFRRHEELGSLLRFGANTSIFSITVFLSQNLASILIGKFVGPAGLGQYNRAQNFVNLPIVNFVQPVAQSAMPLLVHLRIDPVQYKDAYLKLVRELSIVLLPVSVALFFSGPDVILLLIGRQWDEAGSIVSSLTPVLAVMGMSYSVADLFITQDRTAELRNLGLFELPFRAAAIGYGATLGLQGAAIGYSASTVLVALTRVLMVGRSGPVSAADQLRQLLPAIPLCTGAALGSLAAEQFRDRFLDVAFAPVMIVSAGCCALTLGLAIPASRRALRGLAATFGARQIRDKVLRRRRKRT